MSEVMQQGILRMPPECWMNGQPLDEQQRHSAYVAAADRILALERDNAALRESRDRLVKTASEVLEAFVLHKKVETGHPCPENMCICIDLRAAIDAARAKEVKTCQCTNGVVRSVGRDNEEIIEDCPNCSPSKETKP